MWNFAPTITKMLAPDYKNFAPTITKMLAPDHNPALRGRRIVPQGGYALIRLKR